MTGHGRQLRRDVLVARRRKAQRLARYRLALRVRLIHLGRRWVR